MKMTKDDYLVIQKAMDKKELEILEINPNVRDAYKYSGLSPKRYRWDLLRATGLNIFGDGKGMTGDLNCYGYLNDGHIDTALRRITGTDNGW